MVWEMPKNAERPKVQESRSYITNLSQAKTQKYIHSLSTEDKLTQEDFGSKNILETCGMKNGNNFPQVGPLIVGH